LLILFAFSFRSILSGSEEPKDASFSTFANEVASGKVKEYRTTGDSIEYILKDGTKKITRKDSGISVIESLRIRFEGDKDALQEISQVKERNEDPDKYSFLISILNYLPVVLIVVMMIMFFYGQSGKGGGASGALTFGLSKPRLFGGNKTKVSFNDVAGVDEALEEVSEIVDFLKHPKKYTEIGAEIPRGVILVGPPGTGKTLLAKAIAGEANVPFFSISGSEFVEMFVGVGASRVRDLFSKAKRLSPCIVFIDEIDAIGKKRGVGVNGSHDEREQTLNQILVEMDGFDTNSGVIVIAATNRADVLDEALIRPGRFDRRIMVDLPDLGGREKILNIYVKNKPFEEKIDIHKIATRTPGFSGADLKNLMNEAAIFAAREGKNKIRQKDIEEAIEKIALGPAKKSATIVQEERKIIAYHEAGHAIIGHILGTTDKVQKITIVPRGRSLGSTWISPVEENHLISTEKFKNDIAGLLGGLTAEKIIFGDYTTGASNDLSVATKKARAMVMRFGMSKKIGLVSLERDDYGFNEFSDKTSEEVDNEVRKIIEDASVIAEKVLTENKDILENLSKKLLEVETIDYEEFILFFEKKIRKNLRKTKDDKKN